MRHGIRVVPAKAKAADRVHPKAVGDKGAGKGGGTLPDEHQSHAYRSGVHHRVCIGIEPERLLQGLPARYAGRNTQKGTGNKKMHRYRNIM